VGTWVNNIATGPICLTVTIVGLILSFLAWRKKGLRSGMRGVAWSLLPLAMYLTNAVRLVGRIGSAIVQFAGAFVFSPKAWLGVIFVAISALLFLVSGGIPLFSGTRKRNKNRRQKARAGQPEPEPTAAIPPAQRQAPMPPAGDDMGDVEEILRRRGIK
jgi:hypothetical protein